MKPSIFFVLFCLLITGLESFASVTVENGLTHVFRGNWGDELTGTIKLTNSGKKAERVLIFKNDLVQGCANANMFAEANSQPNSSARWIKLNLNERTIAAGESYEVVYSISIPKDTSFNGSYWSLIMVEVVDPIKEEKTSSGVTIGSKIRYAIQVITDVGPYKVSPLSYEEVKLEKQEGGRGKTVQVLLKNNGIFAVNPALVFELFNKNGDKIKKIEVPFRKIYPGSCKLFEVDLTGIPKGSYDCVLVADYGQDLFGMNASLDID
ncbi:hypothetical protein [Telluribacter sp. SYSU D00476]|uniref:COG1470 family protein n=1 Tax=Telluribacter sp. SYSU D00476 TaxID=2811430 RepID=UPI001FF56F32|nr:hypothetical protein [Telluribacter sp. SYSU D00476]